ncbi:TetR family transcriptional regulator [Brevibacillus daliensis]|uniref:TetR family transcriptional regulator n=1 Tax=Brevibacillus daliensis TaxID=2892995 RepID=UPI001E594007|nr:TetR family transcriptional regulator [Brevibacillus daliensis]
MDNKKERIIHAAIEVFRRQGIEKTKISDIVKVAGIAQGTYYLYFPSKLSVMPSIAEVMVEKIIGAVQDQVEENAPFSDRLRQLVDVVFALTKDYRDIFALIYAGLASTEHLKEWESIYAPYYSWMSTFLLEAKEAGSIRSSLQPVCTAKLVIGVIESAAEQIYLYDNSSEENAAIQKREVLSFLGHALGIQSR